MTAARVRAAAGLASAVLLVMVGGCSASDDEPASTLRAPGSGTAGGTLPDTPIGTPIIVSLGSLCTSGGPIRIERVTAAGGRLRVTSWGTRHLDPGEVGSEPNELYARGEVTSIDGFTTDRPVSARCTTGEPGDDDPVEQFDVSVAARTARATMTGVTVHYGSGRTLFVGFDFALCATATCPDSRH